MLLIEPISTYNNFFPVKSSLIFKSYANTPFINNKLCLFKDMLWFYLYDPN